MASSTTHKLQQQLASQDRSAKGRRAAERREDAGKEDKGEKSKEDIRWWCAWCGDDFYAPRPEDIKDLRCPGCSHTTFDQFDAEDTDIGLWPMGARAAFKRELNMASAAKTKEAKPKREKAEVQTRPCACGCGNETRRTWYPGHDAKFHGAERRLAKGLMEIGEFKKMFPSASVEEHGTAQTKGILSGKVKQPKPEAKAEKPKAEAKNGKGK